MPWAFVPPSVRLDRKSTRLNSSHEWISYAVFCLTKKITLHEHDGFPQRQRHVPIQLSDHATRAGLVALDYFFFNDTATTEIYTLSLHDALPISWRANGGAMRSRISFCRSSW